jgi:DNA-binding PadR family transcriptional regulator
MIKERLEKRRKVNEVEGKWKPVLAEVDTVNDSGDPIHLSKVKALQHIETGQIVYHPYDISQAEIEAIAIKYGLENARDVATFLILFARPGEGMIQGGDILYKYHLQKSLFYLWKGLEDEGLYEAMPRDDFIGAQNGPKPVHLDDDLDKFKERNLIEIKKKKYREYPPISKYIKLTEQGRQLAKELWTESPKDYTEKAVWAKELIYPLTPEQVTAMVHKKYPEFIDESENDIE